MARCAVMFLFTSSVIFVGKLAICLLTTGCGVLIMNNYKPDVGVFYPAILIMVISWVIGSTFMTLYETAVDTVFMCFLLDEEWNKSNPEVAMFADDETRKVVNDNAAKSAKIAGDSYDTKGG